MLINANALTFDHIKKHSLFFLFGNDEGLIHYVKRRIIKAHDPKSENLSVWDFADAKKNVEEIIGASRSTSLFGDKKALVIDRIMGNISEKFFNKFIQCETATYLFQAGSVKKSSKLFKYFQARSDVLTVQCYRLESHEIAAFIIKYFTERGKNISSKNASILVSKLPSNLMLIERELEKLDILTYNKKIIEECDFADLFGDYEEVNIDNIIFNWFANNKKAALEVEKMLLYAPDVQQDSIAFIRTTLNLLNKLMIVHIQKRNGVSTAEAMGRLQPPIFFKFREKFLYLVEITNLNMIRSAVKNFIQLEKIAKTQGPKSLRYVVMCFLGC